MKNNSLRVAGVVAAVSFAAAVCAFGAVLDDYRPGMHPVALLGGVGIPRALAFNLMAFVLPGAIAARVAIALRSALPEDARWAARIGARMIMIAAVAFAAQGLLPLDPEDLEATATRLHGAAWTLWWIAFAAGAGSLAFGLRGARDLRGLASASMLAALLVLLFAALPWPWWPMGIAQHVTHAAWFAWLVVCAWSIDPLRPLSRGAA